MLLNYKTTADLHQLDVPGDSLTGFYGKKMTENSKQHLTAMCHRLE